MGLVVKLSTGEGEVVGGDGGREAVVEAVEDGWAGEEPVAESVLVDSVADLAWEAEEGGVSLVGVRTGEVSMWGSG